MFETLVEDQKELVRGQKNDPPGTPVGPYSHGPNGTFNVPGTNDGVFSAMILPLGGAASVIPLLDTDPAELGEVDNTYGGVDQSFDSIITGLTSGALDDVANQPTGDCVDGPVGGLLTLCTFANQYSRFRAGTREVSMVRAGRRQSRLDPTSLRLMNTPVMQQFLGVPNTGLSLSNALTNEMAKRIFESSASFMRMFAKRVWIGSPSNNNGEFKDLMGLNLHINTGTHIDRDSSSICRAADSDVKNFGYDKIKGNGRSIYQYMEMADTYTAWNAQQMQLGDYTGWLFMRPETWFDLADAWPIREYQAALTEIARYTVGANLNIDAKSVSDMRAQFRASRVLPLNGKLFEVILDDSMPFQTPVQTGLLKSGQYSSSIVFVPKTVLGGVPATYFTRYNHNNDQETTIQQIAGGDVTFTTDNGLIRWYVNFKNGCIKVNWELGPRLKCRTPMLGWRIDNVVSEPLQMFRSGDPSSEYFASGGNTTSPSADKYYTGWSPTTPVDVGL